MPTLESEGSRKAGIKVGVVILLAILAAELALSARQQSQTFDEACHIFAGYRSWKNFDFGINPEHPPLVKLVAAIPLLHMPLRIPPISGNDFKYVGYIDGREFLYANDADATFGLFLAAGCFYLYQKKPSGWKLLADGFATGLCLGAKHSGILIFPM